MCNCCIQTSWRSLTPRWLASQRALVVWTVPRPSSTRPYQELRLGQSCSFQLYFYMYFFFLSLNTPMHGSLETKNRSHFTSRVLCIDLHNQKCFLLQWHDQTGARPGGHNEEWLGKARADHKHSTDTLALTYTYLWSQLYFHFSKHETN